MIFMMKIFVLLLVLLEFQSIFSSHTVLERTPDDIPNPMTDATLCGRPDVERSSICDPDDFLSKDTKDTIDGYINAVTEAQIAVAIIKKMNYKQFKSSNKDYAAQSFAVHLHDSWGVGSKSNENGIILFISVEDRVLYISTGAAVKSLIDTDTVIDLMKPHLKSKNYDKAIEYSLIRIDLMLSRHTSHANGQIGAQYGFQHSKNSSSSDGSWDFIIAIAIISTVCGAVYIEHFYRRKKIRNLERGQAALDRLIKEVDNTVENNRFYSPSCPICLEEFKVSPSAATANNDHKEVENGHGVEEEGSLGKKDGGDSIEREAEKTLVSPPASTTSPLRAVALVQCGHTFCAGCLDTLLRSPEGTRCPICRSEIHDNSETPWPAQAQSHQPPPTHVNRDNGRADNHPDTPFQAPSSRGQSCAQNFGDSTSSAQSSRENESPFASRAPEIRFRMNRIHSLFPDVMTLELLRSMNSAVDRNSLHDFRHHASVRGIQTRQTITSMQQSTSAAARANGRVGASRSFGGGGSRGGGGGGGGW